MSYLVLCFYVSRSNVSRFTENIQQLNNIAVNKTVDLLSRDQICHLWQFFVTVSIKKSRRVWQCELSLRLSATFLNGLNSWSSTELATQVKCCSACGRLWTRRGGRTASSGGHQTFRKCSYFYVFVGGSLNGLWSRREIYSHHPTRGDKTRHNCRVASSSSSSSLTRSRLGP